MKLNRLIKANARHGKIAVVVWGRDCDLCESTQLVTVDASVDAYKQLYYSVEDGAEDITLTGITNCAQPCLSWAFCCQFVDLDHPDSVVSSGRVSRVIIDKFMIILRNVIGVSCYGTG